MRFKPPILSSRRSFLRTTSAGSVAVFFGFPSRIVNAAAPPAESIDTRVISREGEYYCGWPTLVRRGNGELIVVWSGGRERHVCPFGRVELMRSHDDGKTWTWPRTVLDGPIDDRDAGIVETAKGSLLITTFTSLAYEKSVLLPALAKKAGEPGAWPAARLQRWLAAHNRIDADQRKAEVGQWMIRSTDGGITWSSRYPTIVNSPHGPIQLSDGRLLYAGKELWTKEGRIGVCESNDDGQTWQWLAEIPARPGDDPKLYHELHAVEGNDGNLVVQIRNENRTDANETLQCESNDGGKTWTVPRTIGVWGVPSFLSKLADGRLLMTYGHRRKPFGNQARVSEDGGKTWSEPIIISGDGAGGDLGYPSTVQLGDGSLLTVWYEAMAGSPKAVLRQARWILK
ncbi:MAG: exo-alpha-sialidase [Verrucomicrobiaceae bacterium]|nr:MAG: exo-alpha-sialidase [Verrucomicrobiaceae bacterium]